MRLSIFLCCCLLILPTAAVSKMVGGACTYETALGIARLIESAGSEQQVVFDPAPDSFQNVRVHFHRGMTLPLPQAVAGQTGALYLALLSLISQGSCTPQRFYLLATEEENVGYFLSLSQQQGDAAADTGSWLRPVAAVVNRLQVYWPELTLAICGQASLQGSAEYNLYLAQRQARQVANWLAEAGVNKERLLVFAAGKEPCPHSHGFTSDEKQGVWLTFYLRGVPAP